MSKIKIPFKKGLDKIPKVNPQGIKNTKYTEKTPKVDKKGANIRYFGIHNHTIYSNTRFTDSINKVKNMIWDGYKKHLGGIAITDHQSLAGHPVALKAIHELKQKHPHMFDHYHVALGDEIYLVNRKTMTKARKNAAYYHKNQHLRWNHEHYHRAKFQYTNFYHFIMVAKDDKGYQLLQRLNRKAWKDSFKFGKYYQQQRLPTYKDWLSKVMPKYKGHVIASTACLGSETSQDMLNHKPWRAKRFVGYLNRTFGKDNVAFELMPSTSKEQKFVNSKMWNLSKKTGNRTIISTDAHYTDHRNERMHEKILRAESPWRDVYDFYHYAHMYTYNELKPYFKPKVLRQSALNSVHLMKQIKPISPKVVIGSPKMQAFNHKLGVKTEKLNSRVFHKMATNMFHDLHLPSPTQAKLQNAPKKKVRPLRMHYNNYIKKSARKPKKQRKTSRKNSGISMN